MRIGAFAFKVVVLDVLFGKKEILLIYYMLIVGANNVLKNMFTPRFR